MNKRLSGKTFWSLSPCQQFEDSLYLEPSRPQCPCIRMTLPSNVTSLEDTNFKGETQHRRALQFALMQQLLEHMNEDRDRPEWIDSLQRIDETSAILPAYDCLLVIEGPFVIGPTRDYMESKDMDHVNERARLMDKLAFKPKAEKE